MQAPYERVKALIDLGYQDALKRREEIMQFLGYETAVSKVDMPQ